MVPNLQTNLYHMYVPGQEEPQYIHGLVLLAVSRIHWGSWNVSPCNSKGDYCKCQDCDLNADILVPHSELFTQCMPPLDK